MQFLVKYTVTHFLSDDLFLRKLISYDSSLLYGCYYT